LNISLSREELKNIRKLWDNTKNAHECPTCHKKIEIDIDFGMMEKLMENKTGIYPHLILHGNPLHGMICYIDTQMTVRSVCAIESIEISKDPETLNNLKNN